MSGLPDWSPRHFGSWGTDGEAEERPYGARHRGLRRRRLSRGSEGAHDNPVVAVLETDLLPPEQELDPAELVVLLGAVVEQPSLWQSLAELEQSSLDEVLLHRDADVEVHLVRWSGEERDSGWHDHDRSAAAVRVLLGALVEHTLGDEERSVGVRIGTGAAYPFEPDHVHRLDAVVDGTLSLHAWSPPLRRTGLYDVDGSGRLRRVAVDL